MAMNGSLELGMNENKRSAMNRKARTVAGVNEDCGSRLIVP